MVVSPPELPRESLHGQPACLYHPAMSEKPAETWDVSLAALQQHRKVATLGARCRRCDHEHRWPIDELIADHKPWTTVAWLARRWTCCKCGSRDVLPFAIGR